MPESEGRRMDIRHMHVYCIACKYDLYGLPDYGECPECGFRYRRIPPNITKGVDNIQEARLSGLYPYPTPMFGLGIWYRIGLTIAMTFLAAITYIGLNLLATAAAYYTAVPGRKPCGNNYFSRYGYHWREPTGFFVDVRNCVSLGMLTVTVQLIIIAMNWLLFYKLCSSITEKRSVHALASYRCWYLPSAVFDIIILSAIWQYCNVRFDDSAIGDFGMLVAACLGTVLIIRRAMSICRQTSRLAQQSRMFLSGVISA